MDSNSVVIIGGGVAGLSAACSLQRQGRPFLLLERAKVLGGRVATTERDGYLLDQGFQVVLNSYSALESLIPKGSITREYFDSGCFIHVPGKARLSLSHPLRHPEDWYKMCRSKLWHWRDIPVLARMLWESCQAIPTSSRSKPNTRQMSSADYLLQSGISPSLYNAFFRPFFGGVFLDRELSVSAQFFLYLLWAFFLGKAYLPRGGMRALPQALASQLAPESVRLGSSVVSIGQEGGRRYTIGLKGGEAIETESLIVATDALTAQQLVGSLGVASPFLDARPDFFGTHCMYFLCSSPAYTEKRILLNADPDGLVNSLHFPSQISSSYAPQGKTLLSVSCWSDRLVEWGDNAVEAVQAELSLMVGEEALRYRHLETVWVPRALPVAWPLPHATPSAHLALAGDYCAYPSLNGAVESGLRAASCVQ